jgi:colicin import membrane protein
MMMTGRPSKAPAAAGAALLHILFFVVALYSTPLFLPQRPPLPPSVKVELVPPAPQPQPQPQPQPKPTPPEPALRKALEVPPQPKPTPKAEVAPAPEPPVPQPNLVKQAKPKFLEAPKAQVAAPPRIAQPNLVDLKPEVQILDTPRPEDLEKERRLKAEQERQRQEEKLRLEEKAREVAAQEAAKTAAQALAAKLAAEPVAAPSPVHAAPAGSGAHSAAAPSFTVNAGAGEEGGGLRGVLRATVGCEHQDYARLTAAERERCLQAFGRDARGAGLIDGIPQDKRVAFDAQALADEKKRQARTGPLGQPIVKCEGQGSNMGAGCLPDDAHIKVKP